MPLQTDDLGRFWCEPLRCWISQKACRARFELGKAGKSKRMRESPCGPRCNVGCAVAAGKRMPDSFELEKREAPKTVASRDKAWGHANCLECGERFKKHSGNHRNFCKRRCAKKFYRPYQPPVPGLGELQAVMEGY
ncbi:MAG: hypothetical protein GWN84_20855 [Gammaproteobacteria bacterium]|nr:hypothetical protein [Gammaproteobacteria bacterium]NIR85211.1 hypothetical protein [Gammaproteobacteria bacterium]NIU06261.1 hypothetical protein [Gammaproteobacteria bacterium]NIX87534.1 hypothetical protein [Gammaproteobacteria bacterium]